MENEDSGPTERGDARTRRGRWAMRHYLAAIIAIAVLAGFASLGYGFVWGAEQAESAARSRMEVRAARAAGALAEGVDVAAAQIAQVAGQQGLGQLFTSSAADCVLTAAPPEGFATVRIDIVSPDGLVACSSDPTVLGTAPHAGSAWLADAAASADTEVDWGGIDPVTGASAVVVTAPVPSDAAPGAAVAFLPSAGVAETIAADLRAADATAFAVLDATAAEPLSSTVRTGPGDAGAVVDSSGGPLSVLGGGWIADDAAVPGSPWVVRAAVDRPTVLADARGTLGRQALVGAVALLLLGPVLWLLHRRVTRPLTALTTAVRAAGQDRRQARVPEGGTTETVALARAFNDMLSLRAGHEATLAHQATHDSLTGLPTPRVFRERLAAALADGGPVVVACLGIGRFDDLTAVLGHDGADRVLAEVAGRLSTESGAGEVTRLGGSEFAVLAVDDRTGPALARALADAVSEVTGPSTVAAPGIVGYLEVGAVGPDTGSGAGAGADGVLRDAYAALSHARRHGLDVAGFTERQRAELSDRLELESALRASVERGQIEVHFQPIVDLATGTVHGAEALTRWSHPTRGPVPPGVFIPVAEETGLIVALGRLVLRRSCAQAASWAAQGHRLLIAVNVAVEQLAEVGFAAEVQSVLRESGLAPDVLCVEVTESALLRETGVAVANLAVLRRLGVHVAIDDFGTGYSALSYLHRVPADVVKIDRSFVSGLGPGGRELHLVGSIVAMATTLGLDIVAEGVETEQQRATLVELGCRQAQGFLFAVPMPPEQVTALLRTQAAARAMAG